MRKDGKKKEFYNAQLKGLQSITYLIVYLGRGWTGNVGVDEIWIMTQKIIEVELLFSPEVFKKYNDDISGFKSDYMKLVSDENKTLSKIVLIQIQKRTN